MRILLTFSALMLLCASVFAATSSLIAPAHATTHVLPLSEPGELFALGAGFVLLARQVRRKC
jgi:hypothetical protein